jgi:hypothetical protein
MPVLTSAEKAWSISSVKKPNYNGNVMARKSWGLTVF